MWRHEDIYFAALGGRGTPSRGSPAAHRAGPDRRAGAAGRSDHAAAAALPARSTAAPCGWRCRRCSTAARSCSTPLATSPAATAVGLLSDERVELTMLIGDATARPIADELAADRDARRLPLRPVGAAGDRVRRRGAVGRGHRPAARAAPARHGPRTRSARRRRAARAGCGRARRGRPRLVTDEHTAVLDDDLAPVAPGEVGRLARSGWIPLGYHGDDGAQRGDVPRGRRRALVGARRPGPTRGGRHDHRARARLDVDQHRRREGLPRGGRERAQGPPGRLRRAGRRACPTTATASRWRR